jgi:hypothetical protein
MSIITDRYKRYCSQRTDINRHLPTLYRFAKRSETISEFGVRGIISTWAFLQGLLDNGSGTKQLTCVDIENAPGMDEVQKIAADNGIALRFLQHDSATCSIPPVDLLFIDTWHIYGHLKRELSRHHAGVQKFIIMHDTEIDGGPGESLRMGWDIKKQADQSGYAEEEIRCGLWKAIEEFLAQNPEWKLLRRYCHNNGLTVLARSPQVKVTFMDRVVLAIQNGKIYRHLRLSAQALESVSVNWIKRMLRRS